MYGIDLRNTLVNEAGYKLFLQISEYKMRIISKYDTGRIELDKALRLEQKTKEWISQLNRRFQ